MEKTFLLPGESAYCSQPTQLVTILGSCVAICLYDSGRKMGGMNHYLLPDPESGSLPPGKIGTTSIQALLKNATDKGTLPSRLVASVYGGSTLTDYTSPGTGDSSGSVGTRNIQKAREMLAQYGVRILKQDVGGNVSRRLSMNTATNEIECRKTEVDRSVKEAAKKRTEFSQRKIGVLVVDDSGMTRKHIRKAIDATHDLYTVGEAGDPFEARERILELTPDVLCLDLIMPKMNGLDFLKRLMFYKPIPTVVMSTIVQDGTPMKKAVMEAGALGAIDKNEMKIFQGGNNLAQTLIPKLRIASKTVVTKKVAG